MTWPGQKQWLQHHLRPHPQAGAAPISSPSTCPWEEQHLESRGSPCSFEPPEELSGLTHITF